MIQPSPLHRKVAAVGAPTLDDVRDNPSAYSWAGPAYHKLVLFSNNGNDFDGNSLGLTLNGCNYKTGTGGGLEQPGGGTPAVSASPLQFYAATGTSSLMVYYTLNAAWNNFVELIDYNNRTIYLRAGSTDQVRLRGGGTGSDAIDCSACRTTQGVMHSIGFSYNSSLPSDSRTRIFVNGVFYMLGIGAASGSEWVFQDFGGDSLGSAGPASVIHMIVGFNSILSDQDMIDLHDPASFFA